MKLYLDQKEEMLELLEMIKSHIESDDCSLSAEALCFNDIKSEIFVESPRTEMCKQEYEINFKLLYKNRVIECLKQITEE